MAAIDLPRSFGACKKTDELASIVAALRLKQEEDADEAFARYEEFVRGRFDEVAERLLELNARWREVRVAADKAEDEAARLDEAAIALSAEADSVWDDALADLKGSAQDAFYDAGLVPEEWDSDRAPSRPVAPTEFFPG
jgi:hypothetical protein